MSDEVAVLVVEDEPLIRLDIADYLEQNGFRVREAGTAAQAIAILEADLSIRVMITDVDMPGGMDGLVLSTAVRKRWPPIKIIVTSGKRLIEITDLPDGSMFFAKPYRSEEIMLACHRMVSENYS